MIQCGRDPKGSNSYTGTNRKKYFNISTPFGQKS